MTESVAYLHPQTEIDNMYAVASGVAIGHVFAAQYDAAVVVYQFEGEDFTDDDIHWTQDFVTTVREEAYAYVGQLDPTEALRKATAMRAENCEFAARPDSPSQVAVTVV